MLYDVILCCMTSYSIESTRFVCYSNYYSCTAVEQPLVPILLYTSRIQLKNCTAVPCTLYIVHCAAVEQPLLLSTAVYSVVLAS